MALKHAAPGEVVDLLPLGDELRVARTHAIVRTPSFEAVRLIVSEGEEIPPHKVKGELSLYCIEGLAQIGLSDNEVILLSAGQWLYLRGNEVHSIRGLQNASLLMTILFEVP